MNAKFVKKWRVSEQGTQSTLEKPQEKKKANLIKKTPLLNERPRSLTTSAFQPPFYLAKTS